MTNRKDVTAKLATCEAGLRRWHSRLVRASNAIAKLEKQRRRLQAQLVTPVAAKPPAATPEAKPGTPAVHLDIPAAFKRDPEPQLVDKLKAKRPPVDKTKMPLSGKAAMDAIKATSAAVTAKREKKRMTG